MLAKDLRDLFGALWSELVDEMHKGFEIVEMLPFIENEVPFFHRLDEVPELFS